MNLRYVVGCGELLMRCLERGLWMMVEKIARNDETNAVIDSVMELAELLHPVVKTCTNSVSNEMNNGSNTDSRHPNHHNRFLLPGNQ